MAQTIATLAQTPDSLGAYDKSNIFFDADQEAITSVAGNPNEIEYVAFAPSAVDAATLALIKSGQMHLDLSFTTSTSDVIEHTIDVAGHELQSDAQAAVEANHTEYSFSDGSHGFLNTGGGPLQYQDYGGINVRAGLDPINQNSVQTIDVTKAYLTAAVFGEDVVFSFLENSGGASYVTNASLAGQALIDNPPTISGTQGGQAVTDHATIHPFSAAVITDGTEIDPVTGLPILNSTPPQTADPTTYQEVDGIDTLVIGVAGGTANGVLSGPGLFSQNPGSGIYQLSGTPYAITTDLRQLVFTPTVGETAIGATVKTTFTLTDTALPGGSASDATTSVVATAVHATPTVTGTGEIFANDHATLSPFAGVVVGDTDVGATDSAIIVDKSGGADGRLTGGGLTPVNGFAGEYMLAATTPDQLTAELQSLVFTPTAGQVDVGASVATDLQLNVFDAASNLEGTGSEALNVTAIAAPPTITPGPIPDVAVEGGRSTNPFAGVTLTDAVKGATDTLTINVESGSATLTAPGFVSEGVSSGILPVATYQLTGTAAEITADLAQASLSTPASASSYGIGIELIDNSTIPNAPPQQTTSTFTVHVGGQSITGTLPDQTVGDNATIKPFATVAIGNSSNPTQSEVVTVRPTQPTFGTLSNLGGGSDVGGIYTFTGTAAQVTAELQGVVFTPVNNQIPAGTTETAGFIIAADDANNAQVTDDTTSVVIASVDDPPSLKVADAGADAVVGGPAVAATGGVTLSDLDSPDLAGATVRISGDPQPGDHLGIGGAASGTLDGGKITYAFSGATLTLTGSDTPAAYQAALDAVTLQATSPEASTGGHPSRGLLFTVNDGILSSTAVNTVTVDRPPVLADQTVAVAAPLGTATADAAHGVLGSASASDPDRDQLTVTSLDGVAASIGSAVSDSAGSLTLNADGSYSYTSTGTTGASTDRWTYTVADGHGGTTTGSLTFTLPPAVQSITATTTVPGNPGTGRIVTFTLAATEPLTVTGQPALSLSNGAVATYAGGSGTNALQFSYTVGSGASEGTGDLKVTGLAGGTITNAEGQAIAGGVTADAGLTIAPGTIHVVAESGSLVAGGTLSATAANGALAGDTGPVGDTLALASVSQGATTDPIASGGSATLAGTYGTLTLNADGAYDYAATNGLAIVTAADGSPLTDSFADAVTDGQDFAASSLAVTLSLAAGGTETVVDPSGSSCYSIGATTLTLNTPDASTFAGTIQDGSSGNTGGRVVVAGPATLTLTGTNTYTGGTTISAGTLQLGDGTSANGSIVGDVAGNGTLAFDHQASTTTTFAGVVSGTGGLDQKAGTTVLTGANTLTGQTEIDGGTLQVGASGALSAGSAVYFANTYTLGMDNSGAATLSAASGTLDLAGTSQTVASLTGDGFGDLSSNANGHTTNSPATAAAGTVTNSAAGASTLTVGGNAFVGSFDGTIQDGAGTVALDVAGTLDLTGVNTYTGGTTIATGGFLTLSTSNEQLARGSLASSPTARRTSHRGPTAAWRAASSTTAPSIYTITPRHP